MVEKQEKTFIRNILSLFTENMGIKLLALAISIILWIFGVLAENPEVTREFECEIRLNNLNRRDYKLASNLPKARVMVTTSRTELISLDISRVYASVDMENVSEGISVLPVQVTLPQGVSFVSKRPESVTVNILKLYMKRVPVEPRIEGPAFGYYLEDLEYTPLEVEVRAPRNEIDQITHAIATLRLMDAQEGTIHDDPAVELITGSGASIRHAEVYPQQIRSRARIERWKPEERPVSVVIQGEPASGYRYRESEVEPDVVMVTAAPELLRAMNSVETETVDITGIQAGLKRTVKLKQLGPRAFPLNPDRVTVTIKVEKLPEPEPEQQSEEDEDTEQKAESGDDAEQQAESRDDAEQQPDVQM